MKKLMKSKMFIAGMLALLCVVVLITCVLWDKGSHKEFAPDPAPQNDTIDEWTEHKASGSGDAEGGDENQAGQSDDESTTESDEESSTGSTSDGNEGETANNIDLTVIDPKPDPPDPPDITEGQDITDHDNQPDDVIAVITDPSEPKGKTPKNGDKNEKGEVYVEGFGWVTQGGDNVENKGSSDGDWDKQIGQMN